MKIKSLAFALSLILLVSCQEDRDAILKNPKPLDVMGSWESTSFAQMAAYILLELRGDGSGVVIISTEEFTGPFALLESFETKEDHFEIKLKILNDEGKPHEEDSELMLGSLKYKQLCFRVPGKEYDEIKACFTKSEDLVKHQQDAMKALSKYKARNQKRNEMDGSVEPPIR